MPCLRQMVVMVNGDVIGDGMVRFVYVFAITYSVWLSFSVSIIQSKSQVRFLLVYQNMAGFTDSALSKKLDDLNASQQSIQTLSLWLIHHRKHHEAIVKMWIKELQKGKMKSRYPTNYSLQNFVTAFKVTMSFFSLPLFVPNHSIV